MLRGYYKHKIVLAIYITRSIKFWPENLIRSLFLLELTFTSNDLFWTIFFFFMLFGNLQFQILNETEVLRRTENWRNVFTLCAVHYPKKQTLFSLPYSDDSNVKIAFRLHSFTSSAAELCSYTLRAHTHTHTYTLPLLIFNFAIAII